MEYEGYCSREEAKLKVEQMVEEAFQIRELQLAEIKYAAVEHVVKNIACAFAAVPLWY